MQGSVAQTIGLVLAANARLRGLQTVAWPEGSIYKFCNKVQFVGRRRTGLFAMGRTVVIDDPERWLLTMPSGTAKAQLNVFSRNDPNISDRESVGFANGGPVFVAQIIGPTTETWHGEWQVTDADNPQRRIWSTTYRNADGVATEAPTGSSEEIRTELDVVLRDVSNFSATHNMGFEKSFVNARRALDDRAALGDYYHTDMIPAGLLSLGHAQIFSCAAKAWVFGGMGSWNDAWFEGEVGVAYRTLSDKLFSTIVGALLHATNSSGADL